jgi:Uma2 family endonuclease
MASANVLNLGETRDLPASSHSGEAALLTGAVLILDPDLAAKVRAEREECDGARFDEVWEGVYIISPAPNIDHQRIATGLCLIFQTILDETKAGEALPTINVSDRDEGWVENFREPDVVVIMNGNPGHDRGTHWQGGPDFVVEILSPRDLSRRKLSFYAELGVREVLLVDREPWAIELHRLIDGELRRVCEVSETSGGLVESAVLPLWFGLTAGERRPRIEVRRRDSEQVWTV